MVSYKFSFILFPQFQALLVHQNSLVSTGVDFLTAQVVWVLVWIAIGKAFAICHFVDNSISICVNRMGSLSQQNWNDPVVFASLSLFINPKAMAALPPDYAAALRVAAAEANQWSTAKYDVTNPQALRRLVAGGAQLRRFPTPVLNMCSTAATELYAELSEKSPAFKKIYTPWSKFRDEQVMWSQFCEMPFDNYMATRKA